MRRRRWAWASGVAVLGMGGVLVPRAISGDGTPVGAAPASAPQHTEAVSLRDLIEHASLDGTLGYGDTRTITSGRAGTLTWLPELGTVVTRGGSAYSLSWLYEVDGRVVPVLYGDIPPWRALGPDVSDGPDVRQLEENLVALGHADPAVVIVDDHFNSATAAAVKRWQDSLGWEKTGTVEPGDAVVVHGPVRVAATTADVGATVGPSAPVLEVTTTDRQVSLRATLAERDLLHEGDAVDVVLPDDRRVAGHVATVGRVATADGDAKPAVDVTVGLDDPDAIGDLDQAPVDIDVTKKAATGVLAVPVAALLALAEGGYAVEVVADDGTTHLVGVELGMFADGWVQVTGDLTEGVHVAVPT
jgi:peptidoglycan hydrolase-like protein with peptidoglycan-binding domain